VIRYLIDLIDLHLAADPDGWCPDLCSCLTDKSYETQAVRQGPPGPSEVGQPRALGGARTPNTLLRRQMLYPLSYERSVKRGRRRI
jgi:hypothetical protein